MATDKSEPRVGLIFRIGIVSAVLLIATRMALAAYFDEITQAEEHRKIVESKPVALLSLRSDEQKRLTEGPLPIVQAMHELAAKGRPPDVTPAQSKDLAPLQGWARMPSTVPAPMLTPAPPSAPEPNSVPSASGSSTPPTPPGMHKPGSAPSVTPAAAPGIPKKKP